jgi:hypothetical protein
MRNRRFRLAAALSTLCAGHAALRIVSATRLSSERDGLFARYTRMKIPCSRCHEPARAFRANADGTETPFCARHIPNREPRRAASEFRPLAVMQTVELDRERS